MLLFHLISAALDAVPSKHPLLENTRQLCSQWMLLSQDGMPTLMTPLSRDPGFLSVKLFHINQPELAVLRALQATLDSPHQHSNLDLLNWPGFVLFKTSLTKNGISLLVEALSIENVSFTGNQEVYTLFLGLNFSPEPDHFPVDLFFSLAKHPFLACRMISPICTLKFYQSTEQLQSDFAQLFIMTVRAYHQPQLRDRWDNGA